MTILTTMPRRALARLAVLALALATVAGGLLVGAGPAAAHAALQSSSPADGSTITAAPPEVALTFNEPIGTVGAQVTVANGSASAAQGEPAVQGSTVTQPLDGSMEQGDWTVTYRVVSADGHPVSGTVDFSYDVTSGAGSTPAESDASPSGGATSGTGGTGSSDDPSSPASTETSPEASSTTSPADQSATETSGPSAATSAAGADATDPADRGDDDEGNDQGFPIWGYFLIGLGAVALLAGGVYLMSRSGRDERAAIVRDREEHPEDYPDAPRDEPRDDLR